MPAFDPEAATASYMAVLSPAEHARAIAYTHGGHWLLLWSAVIASVTAVVILRLGLLTALRRRIERQKPRPNLAAFVCAAAFLIIDFVLELPWAIYVNWWRERDYDLSHQPFGDWLREAALSITISSALTGLLMIAIYALIRRSPRRWWLWSAAVAIVGIVFLLAVSPVVIEPLFNTFTPAPAGPTRDAVVALAKRTEVPSDKIYIYDGSRQSDRYTANVSGLLGSARVAMSDTMFKQGADLAEVRGVVGHEIGHYARGHIWWSVLVLSVLAIAAFFLVDRVYPWAAARAVVPGTPPPGIADPAGFPILVVLITVLGLIATPLTNTLSRIQETDADRFSLRYAHEPDGMAKALVKTIAYRASSPSWLEEAIFYDHPSVERRVHRAMMWKAQHPDLVGR